MSRRRGHRGGRRGAIGYGVLALACLALVANVPGVPPGLVGFAAVFILALVIASYTLRSH